MPRIFISYRRKCSEGITGRIIDRLVGHGGSDSVFVDVEDIDGGEDFPDKIDKVLAKTEVVIAIVGPQWLSLGKQAWMNETNDWVRVEIETALRRGLRIIPVLVDGASMPNVNDLPESMKDFAYRNALIVASGEDFKYHIDRLTRSIGKGVAKRLSIRDYWSRYVGPTSAIAALVLMLLGLSYYAVFRLSAPSAENEDKGSAKQSADNIRPGVAAQKMDDTRTGAKPATADARTGAAKQTADNERTSTGVTDTERQLSKTTIQTIQSNLCVPLTATLDAVTREAIRQAKLAANAATLGGAAPPFRNVEGAIGSANEAQIFVGARQCRLDSSGLDRGYGTAFEKFRFPGDLELRALQAMLAGCDPNIRGASTGVFDAVTRAAILTAKRKSQLSVTDSVSSTLNDRSYSAIVLACR